jgi:hypothetical protein
MLDTDGSLWVQRSAAESGVQQWHVYDANGQLSAVAHLPLRFRPTEITRTHILGVHKDEFDVEFIHLLRIVR